MSDLACFTPHDLPPAFARVLADLEFTSLTPVQAQGLPVILAGQDMIIQAQTGSGKTLAFAIGLLHRIAAADHYQPQALVLCPTRELVDQVAKQIRLLARYVDNVKVLALSGGLPMGPQLQSLQHGVQVIVATPGRLLDHLQRGSLRLNRVHTLVLDEADRMLDMGFAEALAELQGHLSPERQTLLLSATLPAGIQQLASEWLRSPQSLRVEPQAEQLIEHYFVEVADDQRYAAAEALLSYHQPESAVLFCATKDAVKALSAYLSQCGWPVVALQGDMEQRERTQALALFANGSSRLLVATDVAARGLDIAGLDLVVNVHLCRADSYQHRVGRTGRAGQYGLAVSLFVGKERFKLASMPVPEVDERPMPNCPSSPLPARMQTLEVDQGRKNKFRPGDLLGALIQGAGLPKDAIGKIELFDFYGYVAIDPAYVRQALRALQQDKVKNRKIRARLVS